MLRTVLYRTLAFGALVALLAGCDTAPVREPTVTVPDTEEIRAAQQAEQAGRAEEAAELYDAAAADAERAVSARLRLRAAMLYLDLDERDAARTRLTRARRDGADDPFAQRLADLVEARLLIREDAEQSLTLLEPMPDDLDADLRADWLLARARASGALERHLDAARIHHQRQDELETPEDLQANARALWDALMRLPMAQLRERVPAEPDAFGAWLELAFAIRDVRLDPEAMSDGVAAWRQRYPEHVAAERFAEDYLAAAADDLEPPSRIALLLPLSGRLESAGNAVRQGFLAAYYATPADRRPEVRIHDIGEDGDDSLSAYRDAVDSGFELVVGPLSKPALERLTVWDDYPVPLLALNRLEAQPEVTRGLYQFGLAPEDDAAAAAALAVALDYHRVVALTPDSDWGERVYQAFQDAYTRADGEILERQRYRSGGEDFSDEIRSLLNLDASEQRYARLRRTLNRGDIEFEPRRRADMDAVFMGAFPREARLLQPQIRFHQGIGVPVVATSQAYAGVVDAAADRDLNEVRIVETPWVLSAASGGHAEVRRALAGAWPDADPRLQRLRALGADAFLLAGPVDVLAMEPHLRLDGATGQLQVTREGIIHRALGAGRFRGGRLQAEDGISGPFGNGAQP